MAQRTTQASLGFLLGQRNYNALRELMLTMNEVDIASFINALPEEEALKSFRLLPKSLASDIFAELEPDVQRQLAEGINDKEIKLLFDGLAVDDAVDMLEEMPAELVKHILKSASADTRDLLNQYLMYPANSAGSVMTAEFTDLRADMTAAAALAHIRANGEDKETIYTCYVVNKQNVLQGVLSIRVLFLAQDDDLVGDLMVTNLISIQTTDTSENASKLMRKYNLISLPVVDYENHLVGIVTIDDAVEVLQEEATEDLELMAAMTPSTKPYLKTGVMELAKNRFFWLLILMLSGIASELVVGRYEAAISIVPILVAFIPMLSDMGGDAGSQVSTLVIRGMALDEVELVDTIGMILKELLVSLMVAAPLAALNYFRVIAGGGDPLVALTISLALICTITMANALGVCLPVLARLCRIDPALMATPMIASVVDILSMIIYFGIASALLRL